MEYKIKLSEFFDSDKLQVIHCNTRMEANELLKAFSNIGKNWASGRSYLEEDKWEIYGNNTCYSNKGRYSEIEYYREMGTTIYEFEEVDLEK